MGSVTVYLLRDPRDGAARYVGVARDLHRRLRGHVQEARKRRADGSPRARNHRCNWIREVLATNAEPTIHALERTDEARWQERERYWIARLRSIGADLTNGTEGGDGVVGKTADVRRRLSAALRGRRRDPADVALSNAALRARWTPEMRVAQAQQVAERLASPDARQRVSDGVRAAWAEPSAREIRLATAARGERHGRAKLTAADVDEVRAASQVRGITGALSRRYGVSRGTISAIRRGINWAGA